MQSAYKGLINVWWQCFVGLFLQETIFTLHVLIQSIVYIKYAAALKRHSTASSSDKEASSLDPK